MPQRKSARIQKAGGGKRGRPPAAKFSLKVAKNKQKGKAKTTTIKVKNTNKVSHQTLSPRLRKVGQYMAITFNTHGEVVKVKIGSNPKAYTYSEGVQKTKSGWGPFYRGLEKGQDEVMSTATVREILKGISEGKDFTSVEEQHVEKVLQAFSSARVPTEYAGYSYKDPADGGTMQHPSTDGSFWSTTWENHSTLDLKRREAITVAMEEEVKNKSSGEEVAKAGLRRSLTFMVNDFMAPATGDDQETLPHVTEEQKYKQLVYREGMKEEAIRLGATVDPGTDYERGRKWGNRSGRTSVSPARRLKPEDEKKVRPNTVATKTVVKPVPKTKIKPVAAATTDSLPTTRTLRPRTKQVYYGNSKR